MRNLTITLLLLFAMGCEERRLCCAPPPLKWEWSLYLSGIDSEGMTEGSGEDVYSKIALYYFSDEGSKELLPSTFGQNRRRYYFHKDLMPTLKDVNSSCDVELQDVLSFTIWDLLDLSSRRGEAVDFYLQIGDDIDTIHLEASYSEDRHKQYEIDTLQINGDDPLPTGSGIELYYPDVERYYSKKWKKGEQKIACPSDHKP